jgi:hypothetical protein
MNDALRIRPSLAILAALPAALAISCLSPAPAAANEVASATRASGFVVHDADATLRENCRWDGGKLYFTVPGGATWELVTSTSDPAIANPGDGQFHAFDAAEVASALAGVRFPLTRVAAEVFILPYPRRAGLESAAGPSLILLSPGVRPLPVEQQHAEFTHELGHVVQYALLPDADTLDWSRYRRIRGIADATTYDAGAAHADRPHEIFAEDFRALFGDNLANYSSTIENASIAYPAAVTGLAAFVQALAGAPIAATALTVVPAGAHGAVMLSRNGQGVAPLDVFDVAGRRVASVLPIADASGCHWNWDGRSANGATVGATVLFARARDGRGGVARIVQLP